MFYKTFKRCYSNQVEWYISPVNDQSCFEGLQQAGALLVNQDQSRAE